MTGWTDRLADSLENGWVDEVERCEGVGGDVGAWLMDVMLFLMAAARLRPHMSRIILHRNPYPVGRTPNCQAHDPSKASAVRRQKMAMAVP